jgi:DNA-binding FrmR family transcriptional regulator
MYKKGGLMKTDKKDILNRLKRAEGQLRGIQKMIEEEQECIDIVTQLTAVRSSINRTIGIVIGNKINQVIEEPVQDPELQEEKLAKVIEMIIKK